MLTRIQFPSNARMDLRQQSLTLHKKLRGKISLQVKSPITSQEDLSLIYTPGVAAPCKEIAKEKGKVWEYTGRGNAVAIVTDGSAVLGLGDIGPEAALPVMEGKAALFKKFADIDAYPICLAAKEVEDIVHIVRALEPTFGGINLEDISAPRCFDIEERLKEKLHIPVFHDDQHGTAIVVLAGLMNALKVARRSPTCSTPGTGVSPDHKHLKIVISGAGSAGVAIARILLSQEIKNIFVVDRSGIISRKRDDLDSVKTFLAAATNPDNVEGTLEDAMKNADVFIGVSAPGIVTKEMVQSMNTDPIVFAMANPDPEIMPEEAKKAGAAVVATGRSDYPNQVNNLLAFPGVFRGALDALALKRAKGSASGRAQITEAMKLAAAKALAAYISSPTAEEILPNPLDRGVAKAVAAAVRKAV